MADKDLFIAHGWQTKDPIVTHDGQTKTPLYFMMGRQRVVYN